jgi:starch synthase
VNILFVASEAVPFAKTGGLADVAGILPRIMAKTETVFLFIPDYQTEPIERTAALIVDRFSVKIGNRNYPALIKRKNIDKNFHLFFVSQELFFARKFLYGDSSGDYPDNFYRFLFFQLAIVEFVKRNKMSFDVVQLNDWQTALIPLLLKMQSVEPELKRGITFLTIHNLGYQGIFDSFHFKEIGLPDYLFSPEYLEFYGGINFLKGGIVFSDHLLTVRDRKSVV